LNVVKNGFIVEAVVGWSLETRLVEVKLGLHLEKNDIVINTGILPAEWVGPSVEFGLSN